MESYIAHRSRSEKRIAERMQSHVGITVTQQTHIVGYLNATQPKFTVFSKFVDIKSVAHTEIRDHSHKRQVIFRLSAAEQVAQTVHIERESETQCLIKRRCLRGGDHVGGVQTHHIEREAGTH